jgi:hypothetical protein
VCRWTRIPTKLTALPESAVDMGLSLLICTRQPPELCRQRAAGTSTHGVGAAMRVARRPRTRFRSVAAAFEWRGRALGAREPRAAWFMHARIRPSHMAVNHAIAKRQQH